MKRLHIAVLWLFAVGFSSTSYAVWPPCYMTTGPFVVTLSETPVSREQCLALYEALHEATSWPDETLASSYGDEYYCPSAGTWIYFPCGAHWIRTYVTADPIQHPLYAGGVDYVYWQGIPRNISLSLDYAKAPAESTTVLRSVEPGSGEIMLKVTAIDDNTKLPYLGTVSGLVTARVEANSGGHQHDNNRNAVAAGVLRTPQGSGAGGSTPFYFDYGTGYFWFKPPIASGDHTLSMTCDAVAMAPNTCSNATGPDKVWVGIKDLLPLYESRDYDLIGWTEIHPSNHYLNVEATVQVWDLARDYLALFPTGWPLQLNDASLERGGVFDIYYKPKKVNGTTVSRETNGWYTPPHTFHRRGTVIDIRANGEETAIPRRNQDAFRTLMTALQITWGEESLNQPNGHFHVRLTGVEE